jgi:hypothetical protein
MNSIKFVSKSSAKQRNPDIPMRSGSFPGREGRTQIHPPSTKPEIIYRSRRQIFADESMMRITIYSHYATELRHVILCACGNMVSYMRVQAFNQAGRVKIWLCLPKAMIEIIIHAVMQALPNAEFGKITPLASSQAH